MGRGALHEGPSHWAAELVPTRAANHSWNDGHLLRFGGGKIEAPRPVLRSWGEFATQRTEGGLWMKCRRTVARVWPGKPPSFNRGTAAAELTRSPKLLVEPPPALNSSRLNFSLPPILSLSALRSTHNHLSLLMCYTLVTGLVNFPAIHHSDR